jgi:DnaJ-class molecular chaperone
MTIFLIAALCLTAWIVSLYVQPFGPCPKCHGRRVVVHGNRKRASACSRCKGAGRRQRPGSRTVHQLARRVRRYRQQQRKTTTATSRPEE